MFTRAGKLRATKLSRLDFILVNTRLLHPSQNAVYHSLSKELAKLLYLSGRSVCRMKNAVS